MENTPHLVDSDAALVQAVRAGDEDAFAALVQRHRALVISTTRKALGNRDDAEDAAQEAFVRAYRRLDDLTDAAKFPSWLYSITVNVVRKWIRQQTLSARRLSNFAEDLGWEEDAGGLERGLSREMLSRALCCLAPGDRQVVTLYYLVGLEQASIAELLGIPVGTVKSRAYRARNRLKQGLNGLTQMAELAADYGRSNIRGMKGAIPWRKLLGEGLEGWWAQGGGTPLGWQRTADALIGKGAASTLSTGEAGWRDYELSLLITPISGGGAQVRFRIADNGRSCYAFDFLPQRRALAISKVAACGSKELSLVDFPIARNQEYNVLLAAREASLTSYVDGQLVNQVTDFTYRSRTDRARHLQGPYGLQGSANSPYALSPHRGGKPKGDVNEF